MLVVLSNAIILDCINPEPITGSSIVIENGRIVDISHKLPNSVDYRVIDLEGAYVLPGIWDVHIHPKYPVSPMTSIAEQTDPVRIKEKLAPVTPMPTVAANPSAPSPQDMGSHDAVPKIKLSPYFVEYTKTSSY